MEQSPIGDLCVMRDGQVDSWSVYICWGTGVREHLARFPDDAKATVFALAERDRRLKSGEELVVHFPDDCPCYCSAAP